MFSCHQPLSYPLFPSPTSPQQKNAYFFWNISFISGASTEDLFIYMMIENVHTDNWIIHKSLDVANVTAQTIADNLFPVLCFYSAYSIGLVCRHSLLSWPAIWSITAGVTHTSTEMCLSFRPDSEGLPDSLRVWWLYIWNREGGRQPRKPQSLPSSFFRPLLQFPGGGTADRVLQSF